jgi:hypothetical protein
VLGKFASAKLIKRIQLLASVLYSAMCYTVLSSKRDGKTRQESRHNDIRRANSAVAADEQRRFAQGHRWIQQSSAAGTDILGANVKRGIGETCSGRTGQEISNGHPTNSIRHPSNRRHSIYQITGDKTMTAKQTWYQSFLWIPGTKEWKALDEYTIASDAIQRCEQELARWHPHEDLYALVLVQPSTIYWDSRKHK